MESLLFSLYYYLSTNREKCDGIQTSIRSIIFFFFKPILRHTHVQFFCVASLHIGNGGYLKISFGSFSGISLKSRQLGPLLEALCFRRAPIWTSYREKARNPQGQGFCQSGTHAPDPTLGTWDLEFPARIAQNISGGLHTLIQLHTLQRADSMARVPTDLTVIQEPSGGWHKLELGYVGAIV